MSMKCFVTLFPKSKPTEFGKIRTRVTPKMDTFYAVYFWVNKLSQLSCDLQHHFTTLVFSSATEVSKYVRIVLYSRLISASNLIISKNSIEFDVNSVV